MWAADRDATNEVSLNTGGRRAMAQLIKVMPMGTITRQRRYVAAGNSSVGNGLDAILGTAVTQ